MPKGAGGKVQADQRPVKIDVFKLLGNWTAWISVTEEVSKQLENQAACMPAATAVRVFKLLINQNLE